MAAVRPYRYPTYHSTLRDLRGHSGVVTDRDHSDGTPIYRVSYISGGGDISFLSRPIALQDHALAGARIIAEFFNGTSDGEISPAAQEVRLASAGP